MEKSGRRGGGHTYVRRKNFSAGRHGRGAQTRRGTPKPAVLAVILLLAAATRLLFPGFYIIVGEKFTEAVDYKEALAILGEGISGEKKFISAVGEAFTHAFRGSSSVNEGEDEFAPDDDSAAVGTFGEDNFTSFDGVRVDGEENDGFEATVDAEAEEPDVPDASLAQAIISAFLETQEAYSDYNLPAGTTFDMPKLGISYASPVSGEVTSGFGYRIHPVDGGVRFHYGADISADEGAVLTAFADGEVIAVGESATLGEFVMISHDGAETRYGHCGNVLVSTGQVVKIGDEIATVGSTGNATGPCLHFELIIGGVAVNPEYYLTWV